MYDLSKPYLQQGDILLKPIKLNDDSDWQVKKIKERNKIKKDELVVAYGENSGHSHRVKKIGKKKLIHYVAPNDQSNIVFELEEDAVIEHEEHGPIVLPAGLYIVETVREVDHFSGTTRGVID